MPFQIFSFQTAMDSADGNNPLMRKVIDIFISFLHTGQSESTIKNVFSSLRLFLNKVKSYQIYSLIWDEELCKKKCHDVCQNINMYL